MLTSLFFSISKQAKLNVVWFSFSWNKNLIISLLFLSQFISWVYMCIKPVNQRFWQQNNLFHIQTHRWQCIIYTVYIWICGTFRFANWSDWNFVCCKLLHCRFSIFVTEATNEISGQKSVYWITGASRW